MRWANSVAVVTGASRGIGRAVARAAAARGAKVGLVARSADDLDALREELGSATAVAVADVAERAQVEAAVARLESELGPTDVLVNNAGIGAYGPLAEADAGTLERLVRVNVLGTLHATRAVVPGMIARGRGHVVFLASIAGRVGAPLEAAYSATKFAVAGLAEALAVELAPRGIGVTIVSPGPVETSFFDARGAPYRRKVPRPVPAEAVAARLMRAVERGRGEVFVPRWLRFPATFKALAPGLTRRGTLRAFRDDLG